MLIAIGILIGLLIGLTGLGSGSLLTPLLILFAGLAPAAAVGTSLTFALLTKAWGGLNFVRRGLVKMDIIRDLSIGSLPGVLLGAFVIRYLELRKPDIMNVLLLRAIGAALIVVSLLMLLRLLPERMRPAAVDHRPELSDGWRSLLIILVGFVTGLSVTVTSIGSGAALIPAMVLFYRLDSGVLVGTNVAMGAILAAIASISHIGLGNVNWPSVALLLCGSIPGVWLGSQFHGKIHRAIPEGAIALALLAMGVRIIIN